MIQQNHLAIICFSPSDYTDGYIEDPGTYFIRAEVEYYVSNLTTGKRDVVLDPSSVTAFPNPFRDNAQVQYLLKLAGMLRFM